VLSFEDILKTEFSPEFVQKMKNRMVVSYAKYGPIARHFAQGEASAFDGILKRLDLYIETDNTEWLVDAANYCMIEFMYPKFPKAHFKATDDSESPGPAGKFEGKVKVVEHKKD